MSLRIAPADDAACTLSVTVRPHVIQHLPVAVRWIPHLVRVRPMLRSYLSSVTLGFESYLTRGEAVPRNHFGTHPWFSAAD